MKKLLIWLSCSGLMLLVVSGCVMNKVKSYTPQYIEASQRVSGKSISEAETDKLVERFVKTFKAFGTSEVGQFVDEFYAPELYFNDTLGVFTNRDELREYFQTLSQKVENFDLKVVNKYAVGEDVYIHWGMQYDLEFYGSVETMHSFGISQLRVNEQGQVVFHQDFWDANNGLYRQLPYANKLYKRLVPVKIH